MNTYCLNFSNEALELHHIWAFLPPMVRIGLVQSIYSFTEDARTITPDDHRDDDYSVSQKNGSHRCAWGGKENILIQGPVAQFFAFAFIIAIVHFSDAKIYRTAIFHFSVSEKWLS